MRALDVDYLDYNWVDAELVDEKRAVSPEMAVRLSKVFGGSAESWLVQQAQYDLAHVRADRIRLKRLDWGLTHA